MRTAGASSGDKMIEDENQNKFGFMYYEDGDGVSEKSSFLMNSTTGTLVTFWKWICCLRCSCFGGVGRCLFWVGVMLMSGWFGWLWSGWLSWLCKCCRRRCWR